MHDYQGFVQRSVTRQPQANYDKDFYKWTKQQALLLKKKQFSSLDIDHLVEEIESLGRSDKRALKSYFIVLRGGTRLDWFSVDSISEINLFKSFVSLCEIKFFRKGIGFGI